MASYAMLNLRLRPSENLQRMIAVRTLFGRKKKYITPGETRHQLKPPPDEKGYMKYTRYWSNIAAFEPQLRTGDTLSRALFGKLKESYELYPFHLLATVYVIITGLFIYLTTTTIEFGNVRYKTWPYLRDKYWKYTTLPTDPTGATHQRFPLMEQLLDEIEEASQARRKEDEAREQAMKAYSDHKKHR
ncbi:unnamed protein product [Enterobius vermicularis]|uniref:Transmembrane protein n=1 Tax=Enterobius vermicularis TaxID=51028 RepID=A0A0N4UXT9_ENTVE|nr:unnamed protein product [Enterobius vermicularis]